LYERWNQQLEKHPRLAGGLLFLFTVIVFQGTLAGRFVFDDIPQVLDNPFVTNPRLWPRIFLGSVWSFRGPVESDYMYRPLQLGVYWLLCRLGGPDPALFHLFHLLFYAATVWLVFRVGVQLLENHLAAFAGALLWALHPAHVETAAWISALPDAGSAFFYLLGFWLFLRAENSPGHHATRHAVAALAYFPALFFKEMALSFPLLLLAYGFYYPPKDSWAKRALRWTPYLGAVAGYVAIRIAVLGHFSATPPSLKVPLRVVAAAVGLLGQHTRLFFWPTHLSAFRTFHLDASLRSPWPWLTLAALAAACGLRKREPRLAFLVSAWAVTLLPCLDVRQVSFPVADRFSYLPSVGLCFALAYFGLVWLPEHAPRLRHYAAVVPAGLVLVSTFWAVQDVGQIPHWSENEALWSYSVQASPDTAQVHLFQASLLRSRDGDLDGAAREFQTALRLNQASDRRLVGVTYECYLGLGQIANWRNRVEEARSYFEKAVETAPSQSPAYKALGALYFPRGDYSRATPYFVQAVNFDPQDLEARFFLGTCWMKLGKPRQAAEQFHAAREVDPTYTEAYQAEARALEAAGDPAGAARVLSLAQESMQDHEHF
jgi:tetratricopeptide (TPR) repeat protein